MITVEKAINIFYKHEPESILRRLYKSDAFHGFLIVSNDIRIGGEIKFIDDNGDIDSIIPSKVQDIDWQVVYSRDIVFAYAREWVDDSMDRRDRDGGIALFDDGSLYQITYMEGFDYAAYRFICEDRSMLNKVLEWMSLNKNEIDALPDYVEGKAEANHYNKVNFAFQSKKVEIFAMDQFDLYQRFLTDFLDIVRKYVPDIELFNNWDKRGGVTIGFDLSDCCCYRGNRPCLERKRYGKAVWQAEKNAYLSVRGERTDFVQSVVSQLEDYALCYLVDYPYICLKEKKNIADNLGLELPFVLERPLGNTIFEYSWEGTMLPKAGGILLYDDGRIYSLSGNIHIKTSGEGSVKEYDLKYELISENKELTDNVQQFITENWNDITKLPQDVKCLNAHDFAFTRYKYLDFKCGGYAIEVAEEGKILLKYERKIRKIFKIYDLKF